MYKKISTQIISTILLCAIMLAANLVFAADSEPTKNNIGKKNWAEKLGYPAGKKVIILHADDAGMCQEANIAAKKQLQNREIQSAAVMMPCPWAEDMIKWAINNPMQDIGIHLTLTSEWKTYRWGTLTDPKEVPGLLDKEGKMWRSVPEVVMNASAGEVKKEVKAQIDKAIAMGHKPSHIDTHMGTLYAHPGYVKVFFEVAEEYGIPANAIDLSDPKVVENFRAQGYPLTDEVIQLAANYKLPKVDNFTSAPKGETYEEKVDNFKKLVKSLNPGITEIIFHPSIETENMKTITGSWQQRKWEAEMFADKDLVQFFEDEDIIFTNWKEMMARFNK
ncbi:polysaccharide deacetylase family protein [Draconibacterium sp.]|nr:polysaccharide deacetylase family protein [Draconibacterium sp.]